MNIGVKLRAFSNFSTKMIFFLYSQNEDTEDQEIGPNTSERQLQEAVRSRDDRHEEIVRPQSTPKAAGRELVTSASGMKKRRRQGIDRDEEPRRSDEAYEVLKKASQRDEFATYGEHVANELLKLSLRAQTIAKYHVNNVLFHAAMGKYDMPPPTHTFSWSSQSSHSSPQPTPSPDPTPYHTATPPPPTTSPAYYLGRDAAPFIHSACSTSEIETSTTSSRVLETSDLPSVPESGPSLLDLLDK
jgi:hypothetical protein